MDITSLLGTLTGSDVVKNVGKATKTDDSAVANVLSVALPSLLSGARKQSQGKDTAAGFAEALLSHGKDDTDDLAAFMSKVDLDDGAKIIGHLLGGNGASQVDEISRAAGVSTRDTSSILSATAPLLMSLLGKQGSQSTSANNAGAINAVVGSLLKNADVGDLLGLLTGSSTASNGKKKKKKKDTADLLGDVLGNLLK